MQHNLLSDLNVQQQEAVVATDGPILILAGAGSGKTKVLTYKTAYLLLEKHVEPEHITMVTFTNRAAMEMKERIQKLLNNQVIKQSRKRNSVIAHSHNSSLAPSPFAGTFHSLCARILRRNGSEIGIPANFVIYDETDSKDAIRSILKQTESSAKWHPGSIRSAISQAKNMLLSPEDYLTHAYGTFATLVSQIYPLYQRFLRENNALDFDDLLYYTVRLLQEAPSVYAYYQARTKYLLVDEYQDTNHAQYVLTSLLSGKWNNICVVGDASQSIYAWRGADYHNIVHFKKNYPTYREFHLERNYRSTQTILDSAYAVISKNTNHPILKLWTTKKEGKRITIFEAGNEQEEALYVIEQINKLSNSVASFRYGDIAILYRTNAQSRVIEEAFLHQGISYRLVGGVRFYERKEIKDILSLLRLLFNSLDRVARARIEKLGKRRLEAFIEFSKTYARKSSKEKTTLQLLDESVKAISYLSRYDPDLREDRERLDNIKELRSVASLYPELGSFLENVALVENGYFPSSVPSPADKEKSHHDMVTLMTMHAAKGSEFPIVFVTGMEEGLFPHAQTLLDPHELEEERRLCYVALTRAMNELYLTYTRKRLYFGTITSNAISRFLLDIPEELKEVSAGDYFS